MSLVVCADLYCFQQFVSARPSFLLIVRAECAKGVEHENQMDRLFCLEVSVGEVVRVAMLC